MAEQLLSQLKLVMRTSINRSFAGFLCVASACVTLIGCGPADTEPDAVDTTAVDTVEVAQTGETLISALDNDGRFTTLVIAIDSSGLGSTLDGPGPFTLFAPTDLAFDQLGEGAVDDLLAPANRQQLQDLLMNHLINGRRPASDLQGATSVETMYGDELQIRFRDGALRIDGADATETDMMADNGVIHVVDAVLRPGDDVAPEGEPDVPADSL